MKIHRCRGWVFTDTESVGLNLWDVTTAIERKIGMFRNRLLTHGVKRVWKKEIFSGWRWGDKEKRVLKSLFPEQINTFSLFQEFLFVAPQPRASQINKPPVSHAGMINWHGPVSAPPPTWQAAVSLFWLCVVYRPSLGSAQDSAKVSGRWPLTYGYSRHFCRLRCSGGKCRHSL